MQGRREKREGGQEEREEEGRAVRDQLIHLCDNTTYLVQ